MTCVLVQFTKGWPVIEKIPTQIWSYLVSATTLILAMIFAVNGSFTIGDIFLKLLNAVMVSLASNGAFSGVKKGIDFYDESKG